MPKLTFRTRSSDLLRDHIDERKPLSLSWKCRFCGKQHEGNLLRRVSSVREAIVSGELRADFGLYTDDQRLFAAVHISRNKNPIKEAVAYYHANDIIYLQIMPDDDVAAAITKPFFVGTCLNPRCKTCHDFQDDKSLIIIHSECWKCSSDMKVAMTECGYSRSGPDGFTEAEVALAQQHGADIRVNYSHTRQEAYASNTCPRCDAMTGHHYLFTEHYHAAMMGDLAYERIALGFACENCPAV